MRISSLTDSIEVQRAEQPREQPSVGFPAVRARSRGDRFAALGWLAPALLLSAIVYYPIVGNYFFDDDFLNLFHIVNDPTLQYLVTPNGGHLLLTRNALFLLNFHLFGIEPAYYYWGALLTHLCNVCLLFHLIRLMTGSALLASFGAALWGSTPFNEGSLGWYSVYGHVLVATALLLILCQAERLAARGRTPGRRTQWWWYALALVAATSFGTGIAIALLLPFILALLLPGWRSSHRLPLRSLLVTVPILFIALNALYLRLVGTDPIAPPWMALLSDPLGIPLIWVQLVGLGLTRLLFGFYFPSWAGPACWLAVLTPFAVMAVLVGLAAPERARRQLAACALTVLGCYGIIALGRAALMLKLAPQMITFPRYHYVGQLGLAIMLCLLLAQAAAKLTAWPKRLLLVAWYGLTLASYAHFAPNIDHHDVAHRDTQQALAAMQLAIDRSPRGRAVYIPNHSFKPLPFFPSLFPGWAAVFVIFHVDNRASDGRPIYFVEDNPGVIEALQYETLSP